MVIRPIAKPGLLLVSLAPLGLAIVIAAVGGDYFHPLFTNEVNLAGMPIGMVLIATAAALTIAGVLSVLLDRATRIAVVVFTLPAALLVLFGPVLVIQVIKLGSGS